MPIVLYTGNEHVEFENKGNTIYISTPRKENLKI